MILMLYGALFCSLEWVLYFIQMKLLPYSLLIVEFVFCAMQDFVEGARTAEINQEIKRVLTEVLLKVLLLNLTYMFLKKSITILKFLFLTYCHSSISCYHIAWIVEPTISLEFGLGYDICNGVGVSTCVHLYLHAPVVVRILKLWFIFVDLQGS